MLIMCYYTLSFSRSCNTIIIIIIIKALQWPALKVCMGVNCDLLPHTVDLFLCVNCDVLPPTVDLLLSLVCVSIVMCFIIIIIIVILLLKDMDTNWGVGIKLN